MAFIGGAGVGTRGGGGMGGLCTGVRWRCGKGRGRERMREPGRVRMKAVDGAQQPSFFYWDGCPTFLQCPQCRAVFALESEEISGEPRLVLCSVCLHEWRASEKEIIWGEDAALQAIKESPDRPVRRRPRSRRLTRSENSMSVFVGGLSYSCTEDDLFSAFCAFGEISRCQIPYKSGSPRGIGFVEFKNKEDALKAIETLDRSSILGRRISLSVANVEGQQFGEDMKVTRNEMDDGELNESLDYEEEETMDDTGDDCDEDATHDLPALMQSDEEDIEDDSLASFTLARDN